MPLAIHVHIKWVCVNIQMTTSAPAVSLHRKQELLYIVIQSTRFKNMPCKVHAYSFFTLVHRLKYMIHKDSFT